MKAWKHILVLGSCVSAFALRAQNLVPNPSFESGTCPTYISQLSNASFWNVPFNHAGSPDYFSVCGAAVCGVPANMIGYQFPATGDAYAGFQFWNKTYGMPGAPSYREYIQTKLISPLVAGQIYHISVKCSYENIAMAGSPPIMTDGLGIYLSSSPVSIPSPTLETISVIAQYRPLMSVTSADWTEIGFDYTAQGGEEYLLLGNFKLDSATVVLPQPVELPFSSTLNYYFYIDDVSVIPVVSGNLLICPGESTTLTASGATVYAWADSVAPGVILGNTASITVNPTVTTTYYVYRDADTNSITVHVKPTPVVNLGNDTVICEGDNLLLIAYQGGAHIAGTQYVWQNGATGPFFTPVQSGIYSVTASLNGCVAKDTVAVMINPNPVVNLGPDISLCPGETVTLNAGTPNATYLWQDQSTAAVYAVTQSGTYSVTVTDLNGCRNSDAVTLTFIVPPELDFADSVLCFGDVWVLDATAPYATYLWQDKSVLPVFTVAHEGTYWAMVVNACGSDADTVEIGYRRCNCSVYIPNGFTPDQNGLNETFAAVPDVGCGLQEYLLSIFDRWGNLLFETRDAGHGWNGRLNDNPAQMGVYTYRIRYKFDKTPQETVWGKVCLVR